MNEVNKKELDNMRLKHNEIIQITQKQILWAF